MFSKSDLTVDTRAETVRLLLSTCNNTQMLRQLGGAELRTGNIVQWLVLLFRIQEKHGMNLQGFY
jgi:hypothetical protein